MGLIKKSYIFVAFLLIFILSILKTPIYAIAGQWSANGGIIYYNDGKVVIGATDEWASRFGVNHNAGADSTISSTNASVFDFKGDGNPSVSSSNTYKTMVIGNNYRSSDNTGTSTNIGLEVWATGGDKNYAAILNGGAVGIGTYDPTTSLEVDGRGINNWAGKFVHNGMDTRISYEGHGIFMNKTSSNGTYFMQLNNNNSPVFQINSDGNSYLNGTLRVKELQVKANVWADYVFDEAYKLMSLKDLDQYIKENRHLPNIPSAEEIERDGISVGEMQQKQMEKIEEQTLYIIQLNNRVDELEKENQEFKKLLLELMSEK